MNGNLFPVLQFVVCSIDLLGQLVVTGLGVARSNERFPEPGFLSFGRIALDAQCDGFPADIRSIFAHLLGKRLCFGGQFLPGIKIGEQFLPFL